MKFENIIECVTDSFSPAIILPKSNTKIYYSALRHSIFSLSKNAPFRNLVAKDVVTISLTASSSKESLVFLPILAAANVRAVANPLDASTFTRDSLLSYLTEVRPKVVICSSYDLKLDIFVSVCDELDIPIYTLRIDLHFRSVQLPRIVRKLSPIASNQLSNVRPICTLVRVGRNSILDGESQEGRSYLNHDHNDLALIIMTKSTGKLVPLTHLNVLESLELASNSLNLSANDKTLLCFNLAHAQGLMVLLTAFFSGSTIVLSGVDDAFWAHVQTYQVTWFIADPALHKTLLNMHYKTKKTELKKAASSLRFILSTGSPLSEDQLLAMESSYHTTVLTCYTMTESGFFVSLHKPKGQRKLGSCGKPLVPLLIHGASKPGVVGEILIAGPTASQSYYLASQITEKDWVSERGLRYLRTGDYGYLDERGFLTIVADGHSVKAKL